jgi:ABC-type maltose transport system permease subunit
MIVRGMNLPLIIACVTIVLALIVFPLIVSFKAEKKNENNNDSKSDIPKSEWEKIKEYSKKINKKTRDNK